MSAPASPSATGPRLGCAAVIVGAGRGHRLGGGTPKQYLPLDGSCALRLAVEAFLATGRIDAVVPVIHPDDKALCLTALDGLDETRVLAPVPGGDTRARSVRRGLEAIEALAPARVLVHDAARPFVPGAVIGAVIDALDTHEGACAALPVVDAIWRADDGPNGDMARAPVPREGLWRAQTPQGFAFDAILAAHRAHDGTGADDVAVAVEAGLDVAFVPGSERGYKITTAADLARARAEIERGVAHEERAS